METTCVNCGAPFQAQRSTAKFCSGRCKAQAHRRAETRVDTLPTPAMGEVTFTLPEADKQTLQRQAKERRVSLSALLRERAMNGTRPAEPVKPPAVAAERVRELAKTLPLPIARRMARLEARIPSTS